MIGIARDGGRWVCEQAVAEVRTAVERRGLEGEDTRPADMCSAGRSNTHVVFSFREPETESKLSGRVELPSPLFLGPWAGLASPHYRNRLQVIGLLGR